ncbi:Histidine protein methyltransferase 1 [Mortierella alpina]|uniref:protein-histidine N-methyltransferase n=1 Tax=Mortierella alpina TaxID=64518 RepID=A0A9P6JBU7_MORAP|nr:Histidine protein methyltransferase 1 [Mortierella alpina]
MFKFNFSADDLEFDDPELAAQQQDEDQLEDLAKPLESLSVSPAEQILVPASQIDLQSKSCLHSLPSTLHFELAQIPVLTSGAGAGTAIATDTKTGKEKEVVTIYKRNLEDVKFQIAQEDEEFDAQENDTANGTTTTTVTGPGGVEMLALAGTSDLVKGVYEGGLKTWECALDLVAYLAEQKENFDGQRVLELGCGSALPGIYVLTQSDSVKVDLQDYNDQVLKLVTLLNVLLNTHVRPDQQPIDEEEEDEKEMEEIETDQADKADGEGEDEDEDEEDEDEEPEADPADGDFQGVELDLPDSEEERLQLLSKVANQSKFFMGDWSGLVELMAFKDDADKYDLILTSETIYAEESHPKLYATIKNSLKRGGKALVAAKTFYFGVGGDILSFRRLIEKDGVFNVKVVFSAQAFVRREILELTFKA